MLVVEVSGANLAGDHRHTLAAVRRAI